jgi:hypothetical protein
VGIYTSPHPHCSSSHYISFISYSYTLLLIYLLSLNGLLCTVLFILDIYIVNQVVHHIEFGSIDAQDNQNPYEKI